MTRCNGGDKYAFTCSQCFKAGILGWLEGQGEGQPGFIADAETAGQFCEATTAEVQGQDNAPAETLGGEAQRKLAAQTLKEGN